MLSVVRTCSYQKPDGEPCGAPPLRDQGRCFWHSRSTSKEAAEARRLGGMRRKREGTVSGAYDLEALESVPQIRRLLTIAAVDDLEALESVPQIRRLLTIAAVDALSLENSIARVRAITSISLAAAKLLEVGELEDRVSALEHQQAAQGANDRWAQRRRA